MNKINSPLRVAIKMVDQIDRFRFALDHNTGIEEVQPEIEKMHVEAQALRGKLMQFIAKQPKAKPYPVNYKEAYTTD
jgi:hypothetical protein